jgi:NDP-mannose synthase
MSDRVVILAGGLGTRLKPYTVVFPKPLMPIGEYPILEVVIRQLRAHGFRYLTFAVNHQAELINAFFGDGSRWDLQIDYSLERAPLSTMGPLALIRDLPEHFLLMNGDVLTDLNFRKFYEEHVAQGRQFTIAAARRTHRSDYGVLHVDEQNRLVGFEEKPISEYLVSMGVYAVSRSIVCGIPRETRYGFDNLMADMLERNQVIHVHAHDGYWKDIGRPDDYVEAIDDFNGEARRSLLP